MSRTTPRPRPTRRRGSALLVVLALLALFAVIGLSFVLYAESAATSARINREAGARTDVEDYDATPYVTQAFSHMLYDVPDNDATLTQSGFRGYGLARLMYGYDLTRQYNKGISPFAGQGSFPSGVDTLNNLPNLGGTSIDRSLVVNYAYLPSAGFVIDPEWTGFRTNVTDTATFTATPPIRQYRNVAAPYTYPDLKDLYLAVIDPNSGRVVQPSYHRFGPQGAGPGWVFNATQTNPDLRLAPPTVQAGNVDWVQPAGRLKLLRPRPEDHKLDSGDGRGLVSDFPYPPPNADGSYTGDVQNFPFPLATQRNDSLWMYPAGPVRVRNGKLYTALVAPMVIDLNGRVNLSVAGNWTATNRGGTGHASDQGLGVWEVNPIKVLDPTGAGTGLTSLQSLLTSTTPPGRYGGNTPSTAPPPDRVTALSQFQFNRGVIPPIYARVDADAYGNTSSADRMDPIGAGYSPFPSFAATRYYYDTTSLNTELSVHPAQFNPDFWPPTVAAGQLGRTFPLGDTRRLAGRYANPGNPAIPQSPEYMKSDVAKLVNQLASSTSVSDQANLVRLLTTTFGTSLHRPELVVYLPPPPMGGNPTPVRIAPIDLNRPLPDYRMNTGAAWQPDNVLSYPTASNPQVQQVLNAIAARQRLARDIFVRLVASVYPNGDTNTPPNFVYDLQNTVVHVKPITATGITLLRPYAQLAVNIVDYLDPDDIATVFVWNQYTPPGTAAGTFFDPTALTSLPFPTGQEANYLVVGTELPRLAINEAYSCVVNDRQDQGSPNPTRPFKTQFWVELHDPLSQDAVLSETGAARLHYEPSLSPGATTQPQPYSPYQVMVVESQGMNTVTSQLTQSGNVLGTVTVTAPNRALLIGNPGQTDYIYDPTATKPVNQMFDPNRGGSPDQLFLVQPARGQANGVPQQNQGYYVLGPKDDFPGGQDCGFQLTSMNPAAAGATLRLPDPPANPPSPPPAMMLDEGAMGNPTPNGTSRTTALGRQYAVVLRRLANPYLQPQPDPTQPLYNPYVTVDVFDGLQPHDRITQTNNGSGIGQPNTNVDNTPSVGRRHPYAAAVTQLQGTAPMGMTAQPPPNTWFQANDTGSGGTPSLDRPLRWLVHLDRNLLNPLELAHVSAVSPSQETMLFGLAAGQYNRHTAEKLFLPGMYNGYTPGLWVSGATDGLLHPALDFLTVRSFLSQVPVGGREHGRINVNTVWHQNVLRAWFDGNTGTNSGNYFTDINDVQNTFWASRLNAPTGATPPPPYARTQNYPNVTPGTDAPIWALSGYDPQLSTPTPGQVTLNNLQRSILRRHDGTSPPLFYNTDFSDNAGSATDPKPTDTTTPHASVVTEPLKKVWNTHTTTSGSFLVIMTVGFFEVRGFGTGGQAILGKELYDQVPGDKRQRFFAVVDRTQLAIDPTNVTATGFQPPGERPWQTVLTSDVMPSGTTATTATITVAADPNGNVYVDGVQVSLNNYVGKAIRLGFGDSNSTSTTYNGGDGEWVTVVQPVQVNTPAVGQATITVGPVTAGQPVIQQYHPAGSPVSNVLLGNPGPQPGFTPDDPKYVPVVPFFARVLPK